MQQIAARGHSFLFESFIRQHTTLDTALHVSGEDLRDAYIFHQFNHLSLYTQPHIENQTQTLGSNISMHEWFNRKETVNPNWGA